MLASKKDHIVYLSNSLRASWWGLFGVAQADCQGLTAVPACGQFPQQNISLKIGGVSADHLLLSLSVCSWLHSIHCSGTSVDKPYYTDGNYSHGIKNPSKYPSYIWTDPTKCEDIFLPPGYWRIYATNMFCHLFCKGMWC